LSEHDIEKTVTDWAKARGVVCLKYQPKGDVGWPDHIYIIPPYGTVVFIEFKKPGEEPTPIQQHRIDCIQGAGGNAYWVDSVDLAQSILRSEAESGPEEIR
jgi:hypothetical protein